MMPMAQEFLGLLAFTLLIAGQFAAVIAVHGTHEIAAGETAQTRGAVSVPAVNALNDATEPSPHVI